MENEEFEALDGQEQQLEDQVANTEEQAGAEPESQVEQQQAEQPPPAETESGIQKRFNTLTAQKYEEKRRADALEAELNKLRQESNPATAIPAQTPTLEQFDYDEGKYQEALIDYKVGQRMQQAEQHQSQQAQQRQQQERASTFAKRVAEANLPDYAETIDQLSQSVMLPPEAVEAIQQLDNGPEVAYYLGKNLQIADQVATQGGIGAAIELGRISATLASNTKQNPKPTSAPAPIAPIDGGGVAGKNVHDMSMEEIMALED